MKPNLICGELFPEEAAATQAKAALNYAQIVSVSRGGGCALFSARQRSQSTGADFARRHFNAPQLNPLAAAAAAKCSGRAAAGDERERAEEGREKSRKTPILSPLCRFILSPLRQPVLDERKASWAAAVATCNLRRRRRRRSARNYPCDARSHAPPGT